MHDELSAILRSKADSFSELIYKSKTTDVHPVGVAIFVHYWTFIFGTGTMIAKFPFIIFGLISIYYSYKIAENWFNPTVAILTCTFLATLQFPTMYGQLERPYASGMLFSVLMVWNWTQFFFGEKSKIKYAVGFIVFASMCTYNHYFSLLFAGLVGTTGLFFLNKENVKMYLLMCLVVVLLFIPHISILLFHLSIGSEGEESWLGKPQPDWLLTFLKYLFHYSAIVYIMVGLIFFAGLYFRSKEKKVLDKFRIIALVWALLVPCLAYLYSITKTPVLQFSTFTFSLPFLLMFIFSFYADLKKPIKISFIAVIILINTYTLYANRKHDTLFYKHPYEEMARISEQTINEFGEKNVTIALSAMEGFVDFYFEKYGKPFSYLRIDKPNTQVFFSYLENQKADYFVAGNLPLEFYQLIKERYPYIIKKEEGFTYTVYCFSRNKPEVELQDGVVFSETQQDAHIPGHKKGYWEENYAMQEDPSNPGEISMALDSSKEYSAGFSAKLSDIIRSKHTIINVSAKIKTGEQNLNPTLVLSIDDGGKSLLWRGSEYRDYKLNENTFNSVYVSNLFSGMDLEKHPNATIKIYVWNRDKKDVLVNDLKVEAVESNPQIYGLYEPIE
ncbi:MAG: glycosyltransferase family 39 protein [Bacteroidetes bacterium]|nr:glycosyltransferase family 39 protein [Bacteroidota bacterium]